MRPFTGQVAVVTGAGSGIGRAIARALAAQGTGLALVGRRAAPLEEVARAARAAGVAAFALSADVSDEQAIERLVADVRERLGRADILVHSAAIVRLANLADTSAHNFTEHLQTNLLGPSLLTRALLPELRRREGQIVFINSSVGLRARGGMGAYAATKHGLKALADSLRDEVNHDGVRVLSVYPGRTATPAQARLHEAADEAYSPERLLQPDDVASVVVNALCLPRTAEVTDISIRPMKKSSSRATP